MQTATWAFVAVVGLLAAAPMVGWPLMLGVGIGCIFGGGSFCIDDSRGERLCSTHRRSR